MQRIESTLTLLIFLLTCSSMSAQLGTLSSKGASSVGMGGISSTLQTSDAIFNNFSNIATDTTKIGIVLNSQRRFSLSELTTSQLGAYSRIGNFGHAGIVVSNYGFSEYKEQKVSLSYARPLMEKLSISVNLDYNILQITENGSRSHLTYGIGASGQISETTRYGVYIFNFENGDIADTPASTYIQLGFSNQFSKKAIGHIEFEKVINEDINFKLGIDYNLIDQFSLRLGYFTNPGSFSMGLAYHFKNKYILDFGMNYNTLLGTTPSLGLGYRY